MIKYVKNHFLDRYKYDQCIKLSPGGMVYALSWYLDVVCEEWDVLVMNDYDAVWPLPIRKKWGFKYAYRPYAVQQLGVIAKPDIDIEEEAFLSTLRNELSYTDIYLNEEQLLPVENYKSFKLSANRNLVLNIDRSYEDIYHDFNSNTRRNIKASQKNKLQLFERDDPAELVKLFKLNKDQELKLPDAFYRNLEKVMYQCLHRNCGKVWTVYGGPNSILAGAFITEFNNRAILLFTALDSGFGREQKAMFYLINEILIYYSEKFKYFDFEGSNNENLARFYSGFGAVEKTYYNLKYNALPWPLKFLKN